MSPGNRLLKGALVLVLGGVAGCANPPLASCFNAGGYERVERSMQASYAIPVELHFQEPPGRSPWRATVFAETDGGVWSFSRYGNRSEYCLNGELLRQEARVSLEVMMEDRPYTFVAGEAEVSKAEVEWEVTGDGLHIHGFRRYARSELPDWMQPELDDAVERDRAEDPAWNEGMEVTGVDFLVILQRGVAGVEPRGLVEVTVAQEKEVGDVISNGAARVAWAELTFPQAPP